MSQTYVWYWELTPAQHTSFCEYLGIDPEDSPFATIDGSTNYFMVQNDPTIGAMLLEWDDEDGEGGDNAFISNYWTLSQVPSSMWP